jgi:predicted ATP-grasp superfamily ATP-dependent carboligase
MRVLVLDGNENQAVACVRSLARAGHRPWVGAETTWAKAGWSRACAGYFQYPSAEQDAGRFVEAIAAEARREPGTLVLPMTEHTTLPLSAGRAALAAAEARVLLPPHETIIRAFDEEQTTGLAKSLGLVVPETVTVASAEAARLASETVPYPVVLKPRSSHQSVGRAVRPTGAPRYARDRGQFMDAWVDLAARSPSILVQEFVDGVGVGYFALLGDGRLRAEFAHKRLRDVRPTGSGSSLRVSAGIDQRLRDQALAVLSALRWTGVAMVEFRVRRDGTPVFLEVNGRFWNSLALAVHAGADFPALVAKFVAGGEVDGPLPYREGVRCRWILGDVRHLIEVWRGAPKAYPGSFPKRLRTLAEVLTPTPGTWHDNFAWQDPLPELGDWLHFLSRKVPRLVGGHS